MPAEQFKNELCALLDRHGVFLTLLKENTLVISSRVSYEPLQVIDLQTKNNIKANDLRGG